MALYWVPYVTIHLINSRLWAPSSFKIGKPINFNRPWWWSVSKNICLNLFQITSGTFNFFRFRPFSRLILGAPYVVKLPSSVEGRGGLGMTGIFFFDRGEETERAEVFDVKPFAKAWSLFQPRLHPLILTLHHSTLEVATLLPQGGEGGSLKTYRSGYNSFLGAFGARPPLTLKPRRARGVDARFIFFKFK